MAPNRFTIAEAERLLPRLTALLLGMRELKIVHDDWQSRVEELAETMRSNGHIMEKDLAEARSGMQKTAAQINELIKQVQELGCDLKDIDEGLIDFRTMMNGREVYLCWKLGEERIGWWHDVGSGFASRQPLKERE